MVYVNWSDASAVKYCWWSLLEIANSVSCMFLQFADAKFCEKTRSDTTLRFTKGFQNTGDDFDPALVIR